ncbi:MAG: hypothetical protein MZU97_03350 [Bacillus subtilis]|nr:hypothetical protein [Bacillus subtilis]
MPVVQADASKFCAPSRIFFEAPARYFKYRKDPAKVAAMAAKIKASGIYDEVLKQYKTSDDLNAWGYDIKRIRAFTKVGARSQFLAHDVQVFVDRFSNWAMSNCSSKPRNQSRLFPWILNLRPFDARELVVRRDVEQSQSDGSRPLDSSAADWFDGGDALHLCPTPVWQGTTGRQGRIASVDASPAVAEGVFQRWPPT